ncbi:MAG: gliding motility-associated C-terminal domain-containing protein, partial [Bacteroidales bacterium]|nr:gliding motility-associated C-terminal domain-containing protein [Bacteroidales bacterium]
GTGTVVFRYRYTDCAGHDSIWTYTYTLNPDAFTPTPNDTATVHCLSDVLIPTLPDIANCGETVTLEPGNNTGNIVNGCGDTTFVYNYQFNGTDYTWSFTYHVVPEDFIVPADDSTHVQCIEEVTLPAPPVVTNSCNETIVPVQQPIDSIYDGCIGHITYSWTYNDCTGNHHHTWSFTYFIHDTIAPTFTVPADIAICRNSDGTFDADSSITGAPIGIWTNCAQDFSITHSDIATSHLISEDTLIRTWTISTNCHSTSQVQHIFIKPSLRDTISASICPGLSYHFGTHDLDVAGTYADTTQTAGGCDSITVLHLNILDYLRDTVSVDICHGSSFHFGNADLTLSGTYADTTQTVGGCDSITVLHLNILDYLRDTVSVDICHGSSFHFGNADLDVAGTYSDTTQTIGGCDSITVLHLNILDYQRDTVSVDICHGSSYHFGNTDLSIAGTYSDTTQTIGGCDSITVLHLNILDYLRDTVSVDICHGSSYHFGNAGLTLTGTYSDTTQTIGGCDSITVLHLNILDYLRDTVSVDICHGSSYHFGNADLTLSGTYSDTTQTIGGCDSITVLHLNILDYLRDTVSVDICHGSSYHFGNADLSIAGTYSDTTQTIGGCDSITVLHLNINYPQHLSTADTACETFAWNGTTYTSTGTYTYSHTDATGCTQVDTLHLVVNHPVHTDTIVTAYDSYTWNSTTYDSTGVYTHSHPDINGCTQVDTLHLTIFYSSFTELVDSGCVDYTWNDSVYTISGNYTQYFHTIDGADSTVILHLTIYNPEHEAFTEDACGSFTWNGTTHTESGTFTFSHIDVHGCTQVDTLHLTIFNPVHDALTDSACNSYTWNGTDYDTSGTYTFSHPDAHGCTQVDTLHLTIFNPVHNALTDSACNSYTWNGTVYDTSGTYTFSHPDVHGCTQVDTLHLTIFNPVHDALTDSACNSYTWNGTVYDTSGTYTFSHPDAHGCTQVDTLHLTIFNPVHETFTITECESYTWNGTTHTESGTFTHSHLDIHGCTQVDTLHLTIYHPQHTANTVAECETYTWSLGSGLTYTSSGTYYHSHTDIHGCTQVDTLHLTIYHPQHTANTVVECETYTWVLGTGLTYTSSGTYFHSHTDIHGCTQVDTLYLTIGHPTHLSSTVTECESYTWNGTTYTESGTFTFAHTDAFGCTQVDTLHLTIYNPIHTAVTDSACESYTWNGTTYTESGNYTFEHPDVHGCTQVDTLHLTVFIPAHAAATESACESYTWNGSTYTESGDYTFEHPDEHGCTQVDTLHLTINFPTHTAITVYVCGDYLWNGNTYTTAGNYIFAHADENGCEQVDTLHLIYVDTSIQVVSLTRRFCDEESAVLEVQCNLTDYLWNTGETSTTITVYEAGTYSVTATQGECILESEITIKPCEHPLLLPNAFTPNGDGLNDYFSIPEGSLDEIQDEDFHIYIYNRWGELVYSSESKYFQWNGEYRGQIYHDNIYNYIIFYRNINGAPRKANGSITVL